MKHNLWCKACKSVDVPLMKNSTSLKGTVGYYCRPCNTKRLKKYRSTKEGRFKVYQAVYRSIRKNSLHQLARYKVFFAVKKGVLKRPKVCPMCKKRKMIEAHHEDYTKPLQVVWMCRQCHADHHKKVIHR